MPDYSKETTNQQQQMMLSCRIPGYMGCVPHYELSIGPKVGHTIQLADPALQTDQDYIESARRRYSGGQLTSSYMAQIGTATTPSDYKPQSKTGPSKAPSLPVQKDATSTAHWRTTYKLAFNEDAWSAKAPARCHDPSQITAGAHGPIVHRSSVKSCYGQEFKDPAVLVQNREPGKLPVINDELTFGTNKHSNRMLGYSGFVPASSRNQNQIHSGIRSTKSELLTLNFRQKCIGYTGHVPHDVTNYRRP